ncbi:MAG: hypothetical protein R6X02_02230 [Enhygromyxa sp.]
MNYFKPLLSWTPCAATLALAGGCLPTQYPYCEETVTVLDSLDSPTPAGVTAGEILTLIEGQRSPELTYAEPGGAAVHVEIEPGGEGSTELTLELTREQGGGLRWIDAEEVYPSGPGPTVDLAISCPDRIEIDASLSFSSADGVFAELFEVVVQADVEPSGTLGSARIRQILDPTELMGAFTVVSIDPPDPDFVDYDLEIDYPLTEEAAQNRNGEVGQPQGAVGGGAQYTKGQGRDAAVTYGNFYIATFGGWKSY